MQIVRMGLESGLATTGKSKEEVLQDIYKTLLKRRQETDQDVLDVVTGEGRNCIVGYHSFLTEAPPAGAGSRTTTVEIGETLKTTDYGVLLTRDIVAPVSAWDIRNKTDKTFDVQFDTTNIATTYSFSWMVIY